MDSKLGKLRITVDDAAPTICDADVFLSDNAEDADVCERAPRSAHR